MSNVYPYLVEMFAQGELDWTTHADGFRAYATETPFSFGAYIILSDLPFEELLGYATLTPSLVSIAFGKHGFDAADFTIPNLTGTVRGVVIVRYDAGNPDDSVLVAYLDDGLPLVLSAQDLDVTVAAGGLFSVTIPTA